MLAFKKDTRRALYGTVEPPNQSFETNALQLHSKPNLEEEALAKIKRIHPVAKMLPSTMRLAHPYYRQTRQEPSLLSA